jgi:hypothetical protein
MQTSVGIIPCSKNKLAAPAPAWLLYSASPSFTKVLAAARAKTSRVLILSGLHGLVEPDQVLAPYDFHAKNMAADVQARVSAECQKIRAEQQSIHSWCGDIYNQIIGKPLVVELSGDLYTRFTAVEKRPSAKGNVFPISKMLRFAYLNSGGPLLSIQRFAEETWTHPTTRDLQYKRLLKSGFITVIDDRFVYNYHPKEETQ